jgi:hypothetical protein
MHCGKTLIPPLVSNSKRPVSKVNKRAKMFAVCAWTQIAVGRVSVFLGHCGLCLHCCGILAYCNIYLKGLHYILYWKTLLQKIGYFAAILKICKLFCRYTGRRILQKSRRHAIVFGFPELNRRWRNLLVCLFGQLFGRLLNSLKFLIHFIVLVYTCIIL